MGSFPSEVNKQPHISTSDDVHSHPVWPHMLIDMGRFLSHFPGQLVLKVKVLKSYVIKITSHHTQII